MDAALNNIDQTLTEERASGRERLKGLPNRQRLTTAEAAARSELVRRLRIALPALAAVLIAVLLLNTQSGPQDDAFLDDFANINATPEELRMANPRFAGVDDKGHPYEITAEAALQAPGVQDIVDLVNPRAVSKGPDAETVVTANKGVYRSEDNVLDLSNGVTLNHTLGDENYILRTPAAKVVIGDETVEATSGVEGESGSSTLKADRMRAYNSEGRVVFEGNVSMRIYPAKAGLGKPPAEPPADEERQDP